MTHEQILKTVREMLESDAVDGASIVEYLDGAISEFVDEEKTKAVEEYKDNHYFAHYEDIVPE